MNELEASLRGADFSHTALLIALFKHLRNRGLLSQGQINEIGDDALQTLELLQMARPSEEHPAYMSARKTVEAMLPDFLAGPSKTG